jgi:hypothetical protein
VTINGGNELHFDESLACPGWHPEKDTMHCLALRQHGAEPPAPVPEEGILKGRLLVAAPNPAKDRAEAYFRCAEGDKARLALVSLAGDIVSTLELGQQETGVAKADLDLRAMAPGIYLVVLMTDEGFGMKTRASFKLAVLR